MKPRKTMSSSRSLLQRIIREEIGKALREADGDNTIPTIEAAQAAAVAALPSLAKLIQREVGVPIQLTETMKRGVHGKYMEINSNDLVADTGIAKHAFKTFNIRLAGGETVQLDGDDRYLWFTISCRWDVFSGGSNGTDFIWNGMWFDLNKSTWQPGRRLV